jgi:hypothetical protein
MSPGDPFERHRDDFLRLREQLIRSLGVHTVDLIIERGAAEISPTYPSMALIRCNDFEVDFGDVAAAMEGKSEDEIRAAFTALNGVLLLILARLLGKENALRLAEGEQTRSLLKGIPILGGR